MKTTGKFSHGGKERLLECNFQAIAFAGTRAELIAVYQASKKVFGDGDELNQIILACKKRQKDLDNAKRQ